MYVYTYNTDVYSMLFRPSLDIWVFRGLGDIIPVRVF